MDPTTQKIIDHYRAISKKMMDNVAASQVKVVPPELVATYESGSVQGLMYKVYKDWKDNLTCNCPGFVYRRKCKHISS
jgi:hypothetical protein